MAVPSTEGMAWPAGPATQSRTHKQWETLLTVATLGVVPAQQAMIPCSNASTLTVAVATTLCGAIAANKAKVTPAVIRLHTGAVHTALGTHRAADASHIVHGVACLAAALVAVGLVVAVLSLIAVMVPVCTLVLRGAGQEGPGCPRMSTREPISGATEATFHAVATSILPPPGTPATVGSSKTQGALRSLSTAQGAALWPPKQPSTASSHTA